MRRIGTIFTAWIVIILSAGIYMMVVSTAAGAMPLPIAAYSVADAKGDACAGIGLAGGNCTGGTASTQFNGLLGTITNLVSVVVGILTVIMVTLAGAKFITSGGDPSKVASARMSLVYAIVGILIVSLAQTIVHYVVNNSRV